MITIPVRTVSEANMSEHWRARYRRSQSQKAAVKAIFCARDLDGEIELPCIVTLTRVGKRRMDTDNLASSLKYVRDAVAEMIITDRPGLATGWHDGDPRITWKYEQRVGENYAVELDLRTVATLCRGDAV